MPDPQQPFSRDEKTVEGSFVFVDQAGLKWFIQVLQAYMPLLPERAELPAPPDAS